MATLHTGTRARSTRRRAHEVAGTAKPIVSRRSSAANAKRERRRYERHTLTRSWEDRMWAEQAKRERADRRAEQGPRHYYGAWTPWSVSAYMGGHPGRAKRRIRSAVRKITRRGSRR